ncbi:uncharacterized protein LOC112152996 [Oryzias melastigma]|uniref:uncharacterized protein LOC112152996 n=1 Tax=Oryzias melastigma TaxID=30732 RepID=UPI000CF83417|nr:uncharacterized protein LOC112152996 [Oryzias melastigma]
MRRVKCRWGFQESGSMGHTLQLLMRLVLLWLLTGNLQSASLSETLKPQEKPQSKVNLTRQEAGLDQECLPPRGENETRPDDRHMNSHEADLLRAGDVTALSNDSVLSMADDVNLNRSSQDTVRSPGLSKGCITKVSSLLVKTETVATPPLTPANIVLTKPTIAHELTTTAPMIVYTYYYGDQVQRPTSRRRSREATVTPSMNGTQSTAAKGGHQNASTPKPLLLSTRVPPEEDSQNVSVQDKRVVVDLNFTGYVDLSDGSDGQQGGESEQYDQNKTGLHVRSFGKVQEKLWLKANHNSWYKWAWFTAKDLTSKECVLCSATPGSVPVVVPEKHTFEDCARMQQQECREGRFVPPTRVMSLFKLPMCAIQCRLMHGYQDNLNYLSRKHFIKECADFNAG